MTFRGHIQNGRVELDRPVDLPNGTPVTVQPKKGKSARSGRATAKAVGKVKRKKKPARTLTAYEALRPFIGKATGLPSDASINVDHYLYGAKKR